MVKVKRIAHDFYLLIKSFPGVFMTKKGNAKLHLNYICPKCPLWRRKMRFVFRKQCFWESNWKKGNYEIPRAYLGGPRGVFRALFFHKTNFARFREELETMKKNNIKFSK